MNYELCIISEEVLADIRSAAWLEQELHPELDRHRRHQMADICERDNVERVWRVLGVCVAEIRLTLLRLLTPTSLFDDTNTLSSPDGWTFSFRKALQQDSLSFIKEKIHECLVAAVMTDRSAVIIPDAAGVWKQRRTDALDALRTVVSSSDTLHPVRRPLWPL